LDGLHNRIGASASWADLTFAIKPSVAHCDVKCDESVSHSTDGGFEKVESLTVAVSETLRRRNRIAPIWSGCFPSDQVHMDTAIV
jgi:hypothetical protein